MNRAFLYLCGVLYLGYGLWVLLSPTTSLAYLGVDLSAVNAMSDLHGSHGGLNVAVGLFLLWSAGNQDWFRYGLWLVFLMNLGYLGGRLVALASDGMPTGIVPLVMLMEAAFVVVAFLFARRTSPST
ncbi:DUF4345 family protein [Thioalkalivibrio sp. XN279]|uniref:DUF4345 family protein n=1 Tax=Thioalkalivibrio sp. XN279 TaxID=2714953 RepID=UPI00140C2F14|nr:DUF4345 family protein [Thioalkalivibrio sp. XN279]NHA15697.1 DUF4345 domain-containing protein [Thioalkalivibrio sp. XN279]